MTVNRRSFLKSGAMSVLTTAITLGFVSHARGQSKPTSSTGAEIPAGAEESPLFYFTQKTFEPYVGGVFKLSAGADSVEATLVAIEDCSPTETKSKKVTKKWRLSDSFILVFQTDATLTELTAVYDVEHSALGKFQLFLTRVDGPSGKYIYEAVFNRPA